MAKKTIKVCDNCGAEIGKSWFQIAPMEDDTDRLIVTLVENNKPVSMVMATEAIFCDRSCFMVHVGTGLAADQASQTPTGAKWTNPDTEDIVCQRCHQAQPEEYQVREGQQYSVCGDCGALTDADFFNKPKLAA
jgi:NMD protein affecting ribosome stability and mRNA decay